MGQIKDLVGQRFGRLTVVEFAGVRGRNSYWKCVCDCGETIVTKSSYLTSGDTKSCGCLKLERISNLTAKHNMSKTKIFGVWATMLRRCFTPTNKKFSDYGGRGIKVCDEWRDNFKAFYEYVSNLEHYGEEGYSLDRINNDGDYEPGNVRWATLKEQGRNKRNNVFVEYDGEKMTLKEAADRSGLKYSTLYRRYCQGWNEQSLFASVNQSAAFAAIADSEKHKER